MYFVDILHAQGKASEGADPDGQVCILLHIWKSMLFRAKLMGQHNRQLTLHRSSLLMLFIEHMKLCSKA